MSQIRAGILAAILFVAAIGMASAIDYSTALGPDGVLGLEQPPMAVIKAGPFDPRMDMGNNISLAILPGGRITNFRDIKNLSRETLANIRPVPERKPLG